MRFERRCIVLAGLRAPTRALFLAGNLLFLYCFVPPLSLATFFAVSALLVYIKSFVPARLSATYLTVGCTILVAALILYHRAAGMPGGAVPAVLTAPLSSLLVTADTVRLLSSIGASYCFLRGVYALLEPRLASSDYARYYFFFPTYFSGPVMTPQDYLAQAPSFDADNAVSGLARMALGAVKIVASLWFAGAMPLTSHAGMVDVIQMNWAAWAWLYAFAAGVWLFLNFSGFSDLAIGAGRLCNIAVPENFNNPFAVADITDFWRRWHMTLAAWLRACIFTPFVHALGHRLGAQHAALIVLPPLITMIVCGLWHGFSPCYVFWGTLHGAGLVIHHAWKAAVSRRLPQAVTGSPPYVAAAWLVTHAYVAFTWVFFFPTPVPSLSQSLIYASRMFGIVRYDVDLAITHAVAALGLR
jgi:D-alanyl-lipoteichoic acid acyltransferase DltB (MBOAT superfamily)